MASSFFKNNRIVKLLLIAVALSVVYILYSSFSKQPIKQKQPMNPYTQSMKTVCVGRYLLDIPASSVDLKYGQEVDGIPVVKLADIVVTSIDYEKVIKRERAAIDKKILEEKEMGANFIKEIAISPKSTAYIYSLKELLTARQKELYDGLEPNHNIAGFVWVGNRIYKMLFSYDRKNLIATQSKINDLINSIQPWDGVTAPQTPGICIDEAFIAGGPFAGGEYLSFGADIDKAQNTRISFTTRGGSKFSTDGVLKPMPGSTLIERSKNANELVKDNKEVKYQSLRRTARTVLGQPGEEIMSRIEEKGVIELQGKIEIIGGGDPKKQYYSFAIKANNSHTNPENGISKMLENPIQDDIAIAIWDKVVGSLQIRPQAF
jgi:hypothetical protein